MPNREPSQSLSFLAVFSDFAQHIPCGQQVNLRDLKSWTGVILSVDKAIRLFNQAMPKHSSLSIELPRVRHRICCACYRIRSKPKTPLRTYSSGILQNQYLSSRSAFSSWSTAWHEHRSYALPAGTSIGGFLRECRGDDGDSCIEISGQT